MACGCSSTKNVVEPQSPQTDSCGCSQPAKEISQCSCAKQCQCENGCKCSSCADDKSVCVCPTPKCVCPGACGCGHCADVASSARQTACAC